MTGCAQNFAILGPTFSIVKTGGIQQALVTETINAGIKNKTGKNVSEHVLDSLIKEVKIKNCKNVYRNGLQEALLNSLEDIDCETTQ